MAFIQIMSARSSSNSIFTNFSGNRHGYVNQKYILSDNFWLSIFEKSNFEIYNLIQETRTTFLKNMIALSEAIKVPKYLLWFSHRKPSYDISFDSFKGLTDCYPHFVNSDMVNCLRESFDGFVECSSKDGIPHRVNSKVVNFYYPSPENHKLMADKIIKHIEKTQCKIYI